jgi:hypothetical protein
MEEQLGHVFLPIRDPSHRHYLSEATYPDGFLPPLALGNFYVLSMDLVRFIARNVGSAIHPVGTLEDLSVAVWLRQMQVYMYVCMYVYVCIHVEVYVYIDDITCAYNTLV